MIWFPLILLCSVNVAEVSTNAIIGKTPADSLPLDTPEECTKTASVTLTDVQKQAIVDRHNELRRSLRESADQDVTFFDMEWDDTLAGRAQLLTDTCQLRHAFYENYCPTPNMCMMYSLGQNFLNHEYPVGVDPTDLDFAIRVDGWWSEKNYYDYDTNQCDPDHICGHYMQMAWQKSHKVGCAYTICSKALNYIDELTTTVLDDQLFFVCNYYPAYLEPEGYARTDTRPYGPGCFASAREIDLCAMNHGSYDNEKCECICSTPDTRGKWCEFTDSCTDFCAPMGITDMHCNGDFQDVFRPMCPATCGCCEPTFPIWY